MNTSPTPQGPGSVSGAPNLPAGFPARSPAGTSISVACACTRLPAARPAAAAGARLAPDLVRLAHGDARAGPGLLRRRGRPAGIGLSDKPRDGYDAGTLASDLVALMDALGHQRFALYGTDTGMPIAYALAADHPGRVDRLAVAEAPCPVISPSPRCCCPRRSTPGSGT